MGFDVAIDGPAGAGKSTVAKLVAKNMNFIYVDTGAMYRAIGLYMLRNNISIDDREAVGKALPFVNVTIEYRDGVQCVILNGEDVSSLIRTEAVSNAASVTSAYDTVRAHLLALQHALASAYDVVMDGRDIGTVILPDADVKVFLTASVRVRAERRLKEYEEKGIACTLSEVEKEIEDRDYRDMHRDVSPLKQAEDAVLVDTSYLSIDESVSEIMKLIYEKQKGCL